jgi:hypothetical protein
MASLTVANYPSVVLEVACARCPERRGVYRLARLAERYGAEMELSELVRRLSADCLLQDPPNPYARRRGNAYVPRCLARIVEPERIEDR